jgi:cytochrome c
MVRRATLVVALALASGALAQEAGDPVSGEAVFKQCVTCHAIGPGAKSGATGPHLNGLIGRASAADKEFNYSPQMRSARVTWYAAALARFVKSPKSLVPGTRMLFSGIGSAKETADLIAYLAQFDAQGEKK